MSYRQWVVGIWYRFIWIVSTHKLMIWQSHLRKLTRIGYTMAICCRMDVYWWEDALSKVLYDIQKQSLACSESHIITILPFSYTRVFIPQTTITNFITNTLFGRGLKWMGKAYFSPNSSVCIGKNRFRLKQNAEKKSISGIIPDILLDRTFDYYTGQSAICSGSSLINRYSSHCSVCGIWPLNS